MAKQEKKGEKKQLTPEQIKAREAKIKARNEARARVLEFVNANAEELKGLADDILTFVGRPRTARAPRASINNALRTALLESGDKGLTEMDIFKMFKVGRPEMVHRTRVLVLCPNPADRVWVKFFEDQETYRVVGRGATPPKGWEGYVPASKEAL